GNTLKIILIFDGLRLSRCDDLVQQRRHFFIEGGIAEMLLDDFATNIILDGLGDGVFISLHAAELCRYGVGDAGPNDQVQQANVVERRNFARFVGLDIGIDEVPHIGLIGLEIERLAAGLADDFAQIQKMVALLFDAGDVSGAIAGGLQLIGDIGIGAQ